MKNKLPPEPPPEPVPEPSVKVFNEEGEPTFIVVEFELTEPLVENKKLDDLHGSLSKLVKSKSEAPKIILDHDLAKKLCTKNMKEIIKKINQEYREYISKRKVCHCGNQADFLTFLRRTGFYNNLILSMVESASVMGQFKLNSLGSSPTLFQQHQLVQEVFVFFSSLVKELLNKMNPVNRDIIETPKSSPDRYLFYAQEATEIGNLVLAKKFYCERLHQDSNNPDYWFDYAVFKMECGETERAFTCLQVALTQKAYHRNSLLLTGLLLADQRRLREAETCLLTVLVHEPRWSEAWMVLYLFYNQTDNSGGMDMALEKAKKHFDDDGFALDNFIKRQELAWESSIVPNTIYFRVCVLLLKMRMYSWVEHALSFESQETGIVHYLLAVICYYKKKYDHALDHLERARFFHGSDYAVVSLTGHCYMATGEHDKALEEYSHVLESFERPEDAHLLYINCAQVSKDPHEARKLLLLACKHHPTPYSWLCCGVVYFKQNDLISAEECLSEAVSLDSSIALPWGYLTLVNLKLRHFSEAEICYGVALKNNFHDRNLIEQIRNEFERFKPRRNSIFDDL